MFKKFLTLVLMVLTVLTFAACGDTPTNSQGQNPGGDNPGIENPEDQNPGENNPGVVEPEDQTPPSTQVKQEFIGLSLNDKTVTYNGNVQSLKLSGTVPQGATVTYKNNEKTDAGEYTVSVTVSKEGYNDFKDTATLKINKAIITDVTLSDISENYNGGESIKALPNGTIPSGSTITYSYDGAVASEVNVGVTEKGEHTVKIVITNKNYQTLTLQATINVKSLMGVAKDILGFFGSLPNAWEFMPNGLSKSNYVYNDTDNLTYLNDTNISTLPSKYIGKQLNVVYDVLDNLDSALGYVNKFFTVTDVIETAYQTFINNNPENYKTFEGEVGDLTYRIDINSENYTLNCEYNGVQFTIVQTPALNTVSCFVKLTADTVLRYECSDNGLKIAYSALGVATAQLEFVKNDDAVTCYIFHAEGYQDKVLQTSALMTFDQNYTYIVGKRGDFADPFDTDDNNRNCEVYNSKTGEYVGSEVQEDLTYANVGKTYNTVWIPLHNISGISNIRKVDQVHEDNEKNKDTVYVNGNVFVPKYNKVVMVKTSRQYDIEFKQVWVYNYDNKTQKYHKVKIEIPMLFVQYENLSTFTSDVKSLNDSLEISNLTTVSEKDAIKYCYSLIAQYDNVKDKVTLTSVKNYLGIKTGEEQI